MKHYRICGLVIATEFDLPSVVVVPTPPAAADAVIHYGAVPQALAEATSVGPTWQIAGERLLLRVPGIARFLMTGGRDLAIELEPGSAEGDALIFLMGSALGLLLHQRGLMVLHAGAVAVDGAAKAFCGPSGAGKSTLVAALCGEGYAFVADDVCVVSVDPRGRVLLLPDGRRLKLWSDAVAHLAAHSRQGVPVRRGLEKYWIEPPSPAVIDPLPLATIYVLRETSPLYRSGIEPVGLVDSAKLLRINAYRPRAVKALGKEPDWHRQCAATLHQAQVSWLTRPKRFEAMPDCIAALRAHWRERAA